MDSGQRGGHDPAVRCVIDHPDGDPEGTLYQNTVRLFVLGQLGDHQRLGSR